MRLARTTVAAAAVLAAFLASTTAHAAPAPAASLNTATLPVQDPLAQLPVRSEDRTGYERTKFEHWVDADKGGCNTCAEVLEAEAVVAPEQGASCRLSGGAWFSPYDDRFIQEPGGVDIGHLVPLAEPAPPTGARRNVRRTPTTSVTSAR